MSTMWALIQASLSDAERAEELFASAAARRGDAKLDQFLTRSIGNGSPGRASGAAPTVTFMDRLFLDLFPLARAVHVRSEASIHDQHDQAGNGREKWRR